MEIENPYFSVEISSNQVESIKNGLRKVLKESLTIPFEDLPNPHISISYGIGKGKKEDLETICEEICEAPFCMDITGFELIYSEFYNGTILCLALNHNDDFLYSQEFLKENFQDKNIEFKEFKGGFKAHISLFLFKEISPEEIEILPRYLEICFNNLSNKIIGERFCVYSGSREKLIEKTFKQK